MSKEVTKHRVHVKHGRWKGHRGWAYFTEDQDNWNGLSVRLDQVEIPARRSRSLDPITAGGVCASDTAASETETVRGFLVRLSRMEVEVLSDLEALAEVTEHQELPTTTYKLLK